MQHRSNSAVADRSRGDVPVSNLIPLKGDSARSTQSGDESDSAALSSHVVGLALERVARLLPSQGPLTAFVHHNTLHAFEELPFDRAVAEAAALFGCEPYLLEEEYREGLKQGRIALSDIDIVLRRELGEEGAHPVATLPATRHDLTLAVLRHGIPSAAGPELEWLLAETDVLDRFRHDADRRFDGRAGDRPAVQELWATCVRAAARAPDARRRAPDLPIRHRDLVLRVTSIDIDAWVDPVLVALGGAFLDQGLAYWPMPRRELGLRGCFLRIYGAASISSSAVDTWRRELPAVLEGEHERSDEESVTHSLVELGVAPSETEAFLAASALALRGWTGMMHQIGLRPDRAPAFAPPASLAGFLAVRLLLERAALASVCASSPELRGPLSGLRERARELLAPAPLATAPERAWPLFHAAQLLGWSAHEIAGLDEPDIRELFDELDRLSDLECRRLLHLAYERRYVQSMLDALVLHPGERAAADPPTFQAIFCLDEREESMRRALEETAPTCETFGAAGYFGVAMSYRGVADAHARPLCPIAIKPPREVMELPCEAPREIARWRERSRRALGGMRRGIDVGSRTFVRGTIVSTLLGALAAIPLVSRVLFPRFTARMRRRGALLVDPARRTTLALPFSNDEMAEIVERQLVDIGLVASFSSIVIAIGHRSHSLNNPQESAHDCGACGGGHGGPNARAFARMANDAGVRERLRGRGLTIPDMTIFVGAEHDTCDDTIVFFDLGALPESHRPAFEAARSALETARASNARERCRRFESAPRRISPRQALEHVEARAQDLAQPRPEYGHATNAACVVGRRRRTRGLFLDRRVFLVSYDPTRDDDRARVLARVLESVVPVVAGINLEYWFGRVDPVGYGCATKLPHNVTAMLGVMDGHASDLRTGLPWQMVEIHEPVRLLLVVEAHREVLERVLAQSRAAARLVDNQWIRVAALSPDSDEVFELHAGRWLPHRAPTQGLPVVAESFHWYRGRPGPLSPVRIDPTAVRRRR